jgi:hypothetical protein
MSEVRDRPGISGETLMRLKVVAAAVALAAAAALVASTAVAQATPVERAGRTAAAQLGYTQVVVAPDVYKLAQSAGIVPAPLGPAKAAPYRGTVAAEFPIIEYRLLKLRIQHAGGLSLSTSQRKIEFRSFYIDLGRGMVSAKVSGSIGDVGRVDLFRLGLSDRYDLGLLRLGLTTAAAGALNQTFGVSAFSEGETFGYATPRPFAKF